MATEVAQTRTHRLVPLKVANAADQIGRKVRRVADEVEEVANEVVDKGTSAAVQTAEKIQDSLTIAPEEKLFLRALGKDLVTPSVIGSLALLTYEVHKYMVVREAKQRPKVVSKIEGIESDKVKQQDMQYSLVSFIPSLFGFSLMVSSKWGAALGVTWLLGKWAFLFGKRFGAQGAEWWGHIVSQLAQLGLLNGLLIAAGRALLRELYRMYTASAHQPGALPA